MRRRRCRWWSRRSDPVGSGPPDRAPRRAAPGRHRAVARPCRHRPGAEVRPPAVAAPAGRQACPGRHRGCGPPEIGPPACRAPRARARPGHRLPPQALPQSGGCSRRLPGPETRGAPRLLPVRPPTQPHPTPMPDLVDPPGQPGQQPATRDSRSGPPPHRPARQRGLPAASTAHPAPPGAGSPVRRQRLSPSAWRQPARRVRRYCLVPAGPGRVAVRGCESTSHPADRTARSPTGRFSARSLLTSLNQ